MTLDLPTLMVMQSFALASAGAILVFAWLQNRAVTALAIWGLADFLAGAGILALALGATTQQPAWSAAGGVLLCSQSALIWKAARQIDGKPAPLVLVFLGAALIGVAGGVPVLRSFAGSVALAGGAAYTLAAAVGLWRSRHDRLISRWALIAFMAVHSFALWIGTFSTFIGSTGQDTVPAVLSLFGFIYFESIVFALGTAVFVLAFIKERNEAASMAAARTDGLTGVANRAALLENAELALTRCRRDAAPLSIVMFDLDRFKSINDRFGHAVGDAVLRKFCEIAGAALRPQDLFGRLGGEEFAVIMPGCSVEAACIRAERIRAAFIESCRSIGTHQVKATVSGGVAMSEASQETLDALLEMSDAALYEAKAEGRNRIKRAAQDTPAGGASNVFRVA
jgi:diguanylate cyclase (GGDEF)-like protein